MRQIVEASSLKPINVTWELTLACNLRCKHCGSAAGKCREDEISLDRALDLCDELHELGTKEVTLIGGEPLLSDKWYPVAKKLYSLGIKVNFVSNGTLISDKAVSMLKEARINNFGVSIDGMPETNDSIRGKGAYEKIEKAIKRLHKAGIKVSVATTISKYNFPELEQVYNELMRMKVKVWQIQLAMPVGRMKEEDMIAKEDLKKLVEFIIKVRQDGAVRVFPGCNIGYFGGLEEKYRTMPEEQALPFWTGCYSGVFEMGIMSNGSIKGCLAMKDRLIEGTIKKNTLKEIWKNPEAFAYNRKFKGCKGGCAKCEYGEICRGGCPIISEALTGTMNNDPYCIERIEQEAGR